LGRSLSRYGPHRGARVAPRLPPPRYPLPPRHDRYSLRHRAPRGTRAVAASGMIGFLHPWALVGLAAAAIPVLIHLLARREPPTVLFPAVRYLITTTREHQRRLKLQHLLLLLFRTLLIIALVLAAAGPIVPGRGGVAGHAPSALVLVVDNSPSS